jgi:hypothetical protein
MSDYLSYVAARSLNLTTVVQPRLASLFEPLPNSIHTPDLPSELVETSAIERIAESAEPPSSKTTVPSPTVALPPPSPLTNAPVSATSLPSTPPTSTPTPSVITPSTSGPSPPAAEALAPKMAASNSFPPATEISRSYQEPVEYASLVQPQPAIVHLSATQSSRLTISPSEPKSSLEPRSLVPTRPVIQPPIAALPKPPFSPPVVKPSTPPTIQVSIGRIDVRAIATPTPPRRTSTPSQPKLSLEEYLRSRSPSKSRQGGRP